MSTSELKEVLLLLLGEVDDLRVNQDVIAAELNGPRTLGDKLGSRQIAEARTKRHLADLKTKIENLS